LIKLFGGGYGSFRERIKRHIITGLAIGVGTAILAPIVIPVLAGIVKPLAKSAIKGGITLYETNKENLPR